MISIIAAQAKNRVIGKDNKLPWKLPADLKRFRHLTTGNSIVMGRKTYESIGRALPKRQNIIITRQTDYQADKCEIAHSLNEAIQLAKSDEIFIIGGSQIYEEALPIADRVYLTEIHVELEGDAFFPKIPSEWKVNWKQDYMPDDKNPHKYSFMILGKELDFLNHSG